jgi:hypothetical protein
MKQCWRVCSASSNLLIAAAGAGILSYPFAMAQQGVAANIASTLLFACVNAFTLSVVGAAAHRASFRYEQWQPRKALEDATYEEAIGAWLGPFWQQIAAVSVLVGSIGALSGFTVIICDLVTPLLEAAAGGAQACSSDSPECLRPVWLLSQRWAVAAIFALLVLPLGSCRTIAALAHSSVVAAVTVCMVTLVLLLHLPDASSSRDIPWGMGQSSWGFFVGVPISIFALGNHLQLVPTWKDVVSTVPHDPLARRILTWSMILAAAGCSVLYCLTGLFGLLSFGTGVCGDVLMNLASPLAPGVACANGLATGAVEPSATGLLVWDSVTKAFMAGHVILASPVILYPCRETVRGWLRPVLLRTRWGWVHDSVVGRTVVSFIVIGVCAALAVGAPGAQVVFGLVGSTISVTQIHLLPAGVLWEWARQAEHPAAKVERLLPDDEVPPVQRLCGWGESPRVLRAQALTVWLLGGLAGGLGTFITVKNTWFS